MEDVVHFEEKEKMERGKVTEQEKGNLVQYFHEIDRTLREQILGRENKPLILAGVEYLLPLYRQANSYPHLIKEELTGNFEHATLGELLGKAEKKMQTYFTEERQKAIQKILDHGPAPTTSFLQDVIRAAFEGRVSQLFIAKGTMLWGQYTSKPEEPVIHEEEEDGDDNLTNQVVIQTISHGGQVYLLDAEKMPAEAKMVAVLRYS